MKLIKVDGISYTFEIEVTDDIETLINADTSEILYESEDHKNKMETEANKLLIKHFKE